MILRPPVGGEVFRGLEPAYIGLRGEDRTRAVCWPRSLVLRLMLICILLATIAGSVLLIFALRNTNSWPWGRNGNVMRSRFCHVVTSYPGIDVDESVMYEPKAVMVSHPAVADFPPITLFHLLGNEGMTVMQAEGSCYVYPLTPEVAEAVPADDTLADRIEVRRCTLILHHNDFCINFSM